MGAFAIQSRLSDILETEREGLKLSLSPYCQQRVENIVNIGVQRMTMLDVTQRLDKIHLAESNIKRLIEYLSNYAKDCGTYPEIEDISFDNAMAECFPLWPYC